MLRRAACALRRAAAAAANASCGSSAAGGSSGVSGARNAASACSSTAAGGDALPRLHALQPGPRFSRALHGSAAAAAKAAAAPAKKVAKKGGAKGPLVEGKSDPTTATGVNLLKAGSDPKLGPDSEYPDWLWELANPLPPLGTLSGKPAEEMTLAEGLRWGKLQRRRDIGAGNLRTSKKGG